MTECATWRCEADALPHVWACHAHLPRYEIPKPTECPECGYTGNQHITIHDDLYICAECEEIFDPRRFGDG